MKKYLIVYFTKDPKAPEMFYGNSQDMAQLIEKIRDLTIKKAKFCVYELGECLGDFS